MIFELVELIEFSGPKATVYSLYLEDENQTLFDKFLSENIDEHRQEILSILDKINKISYKFGAERMFFKENEGKLGDLVCALYDSPDSNLRLYCIRLGKTIIILGGGGYKSKLIRALQEDPLLTKENLIMRKFSEILGKRMKERDIFWIDEMTLDGNFIIDTDE
jgi:hypothetical protein